MLAAGLIFSVFICVDWQRLILAAVRFFDLWFSYDLAKLVPGLELSGFYFVMLWALFGMMFWLGVFGYLCKSPLNYSVGKSAAALFGI